MKWTGSNPLYLYQEVASDGTIYNSFSTNYTELKEKGNGKIR